MCSAFLIHFTMSVCPLRREVDLDGKNIGGWTPLMYASYIGHDNIANLLLEAGVNVNATTAKGLTPLMLAASCGNESIAYFLLQVQKQHCQMGPVLAMLCWRIEKSQQKDESFSLNVVYSVTRV